MVQKFHPRIDKIWTQKMYQNKFKTVKSKEIFSFSFYPVLLLLFFFLSLSDLGWDIFRL